MSKGPGRRQLAILAALADRWAFYLRDLIAEPCTEAAYNATLRAALHLEASGKIAVTRFLWGGGRGGKRLVVHRIGTTFTGTDRNELDK